MTENQFEPIMAAIQTLTVKFDSKFDKMEGRFDKLEGRFDELEGRFDKSEGRFDKLEGRLDNVEAQLVNMNGELKRIQHWTPYNENHDIIARLEAITGRK